MTTEFAKISLLLEELKEQLDKILNAQSTTTEILHTYKYVKDTLESYVFKIAKFKNKLKEKDPEKQIYGPNMQKRVQAVVDTFENLYSMYEEKAFPIFDNSLEILLEQEKQLEKQNLLQKKEESLAFSKDLSRKTLEDEQARIQKRQLMIAEENLYKKAEENRINKELKKEQERKDKLNEAIAQYTSYKPLNGNTSKIICLDGLLKMLILEFDDFQTTLNNIITFVSQLNSNPSELSNRLIRLENPQFVRDIGLKPGSLIIFKSFGFILTAANNLKDQFEQINFKPSDLENLYLYLEEPDSSFTSNAYENWLNWVDNIQNIYELLKTCQAKAFDISRNQSSENKMESMINYLKQLINFS